MRKLPNQRIQLLDLVPLNVAVQAVALAFVVMAGGVSGSASAQGRAGQPAKAPFEIIYAGKNAAAQKATPPLENSASSQTAVKAAPSKVQAVEGQPAYSEKPALLTETEVANVDLLAQRLVAQSREAWMRGLLDQPSYAAWLEIAATTQLQIAQRQGDQERVIRTLREQASLWDEAAARLEEFNQPGSQGWQADLSHARAMAMREKMRHSIAVGRPLNDRDQQVYTALVAEHLELRRQDFHAGAGSAAGVLSAARLVDERLVVPEKENAASGDASPVRIASFQVKSPVTLRQALDEIHQPVFLETYPRAVSLRDHTEDRAEILRASLLVGFLETPAGDRSAERFLTQLDHDAEEISTVQFERYQTGTATPGGMVRQWWLHETLAAAVGGDSAKSAFPKSQTQRLRQIYQMSNSLQDRRGRNSADAAAAETLWAVRQLDLQPLNGHKLNRPIQTPTLSKPLSVVEVGPNGSSAKEAAH